MALIVTEYCLADMLAIYRLYFASSAANLKQDRDRQIKHTEHKVQLHTSIIIKN